MRTMRKDRKKRIGELEKQLAEIDNLPDLRSWHLKTFYPAFFDGSTRVGFCRFMKPYKKYFQEMARVPDSAGWLDIFGSIAESNVDVETWYADKQGTSQSESRCIAIGLTVAETTSNRE